MGVSLPVRRIGVFGGAFDPPHLMHVALVRTALAQLQLDALYVFPTGHAWHKSRTLSPAADRLAMAQLAFGDIPGVVVDKREIERSGPTYTIDTLHELQAEKPQAQLYLVMGEDQATRLPTWHGWEEIVRAAIICVASRADSTSANGPFSSELGSEPVPEHPSAGSFQALQVPPMELSATDIRHRAATSQGIAHLVPEGVARYIDHHLLYRTDR
ncbi:nicotinate (nicotinamide) nucleotide adenylyltransferase [Rhodoferax sp.]|uniref:nicotinate (nicotinamide) nucleotide adenylyltransferase n=1 Tax=Rhodoferax sp. TaxID=50421 RepID=UPI0025F64B03|nr:nicotinate (nicotinamide) nucleotide adenylyltransferase [Rhodoferax sp.]